MRKILPLVVILMLIPIASAEVVSVPSEIHSKGIVGVPSSFKVNLTVNPVKGHVPMDVVLAIDCSPSMSRFSKVIYGPETVNITKKCGCCCGCCGKWVAIANFTLDQTQNVEVILSYPHEDYYNESWRGYDRIDIVLDNPPHHHGCCGGCKCCRWVDDCTDPAAFIFENVPKGKHTIYAKLHGKPRTEMRVLVVALPPSKIDAAKEVAKEFVGMLSDYDRAGIVRIGSVNTTKIVLPLTSDRNSINSTIDGLSLDDWICIDESGGWHHGCHGCCGCKCGRIVRIFELTALGEGIEKACEVLNASNRNSVKAIILLTDGDWNNGISPVDVAKVAKSLGYRIYTIGFGVVNESLLREIAEITGGKYYYAPSCEDLKDIFNDIYREIVAYAKNVTLKLEFVNPNVEYVKSVPSGNLSGNTVIWHWSELKNSTSIEVWVNSTKAGNQLVAIGNLTYEYYNLTTGSIATAHQSFNVTMNFINNPPVITVSTSDITVEEEQTCLINVKAYDPDGHKVNMTYSTSPQISNVKFTFITSANTVTSEFRWTPPLNFVDNGLTERNVTVTFTATDEYGASNSTHVIIKVINVTPKVYVPPEVRVCEGDLIKIVVIVKHVKPEFVGFEIIPITQTIDDIYDKAVISYAQLNETAWMFALAPQYGFVDKKKNNETLKVIFTAYDSNGNVLASNVTTIVVENKTAYTYPVVENTRELTNLTIKQIRVGVKYTNVSKPLYVGDLIKINITFINATEGKVTVNNITIWNETGWNDQITNRTVCFIPNTAGEYILKAWAINATNLSSTYIADWVIRIKPVTPS